MFGKTIGIEVDELGDDWKAMGEKHGNAMLRQRRNTVATLGNKFWFLNPAFTFRKDAISFAALSISGFRTIFLSFSEKQRRPIKNKAFKM